MIVTRIQQASFFSIFILSLLNIQDSSAQLRYWKADSTSNFEVGTQIRAWTIHDEGMSAILDNMQSMAGINNLYMVVVMHQEHRPYQAPEFPHNPARDTFQAEDSRVTFFPDMDRYGEVKPLLSDFEWIRETDWLQLMVDSCRARGMAVGAEVSHFPIPKSLIRERSDWQQKKIDGSSANNTRFCPNSPEPRAYVITLFGDLAENYDLDYLQTCQHLFWTEDIDEGGACFCKHCIAEAKKTGFDLEAAIPVLAANKDAQPERDQWREFRAYSTKKFYQDISEEIKRVRKNPLCHLRYNDTYPYRGWDPRDLSMYIDEVSEHLGSLVNQDHQEQKGNPDESFEIRKKWLETNRRNIGPDMPLISGIAPRMKATPELVKAGIKVVLEHPANVNGLALKHYDGASFGLLRAFKQGMIEAGVQGLIPTYGKEFEDMQLSNFSPVDDYVEEWGVETTGRGMASYSFDLGSGIYDIRVTYFDEEQGHSKVTIYVAGKEMVNFFLDEDSDCWRSRMFHDIAVNAGDEIKVVAESDQGETVRLDYIEFISKQLKAEVNIGSLGALGDGSDVTGIIQRAIDDVTQKGGGIVRVPAGKYVISTIFLKSNVILHLDEGAELLGSPEYEKYIEIPPVYETFFLREDRYPKRVLIVAVDAENAAIQGAGIIDGNGQHPKLKVKRMEAINTVRFIRCKNMRIEGVGGRLTVRNSSHWTIQPINVDTLCIRNVFISNFGGNTPDGLAISDCRNVLVENVEVESDDDAITLKSGTPEIVMENIIIRDCIGRSRVCGFKTGPQTFGTIRNVSISNCHFEGAGKPPGTQYDPQNGIFLNVSNGGVLEDIRVEDCTVEGFPSALSVYIAKLTDEYWKTYWPGAALPSEFGTIRNISFKNIEGRNLGDFGILVEGRETSPLENISFSNLNLATAGGGVLLEDFPEKPNDYPNLYYLYEQLPAFGMYLRHVKGITLENVNISCEDLDPRPMFMSVDVQNYNAH
ncbi:MAG: glycosyl hydrolase family 28 protein [Bacteroides sp.]|nr:glycosyl hydrolase family 28 protein [Bacteroides sp.]